MSLQRASQRRLDGHYVLWRAADAGYDAGYDAPRPTDANPAYAAGPEAGRARMRAVPAAGDDRCP
jgi:hypothetical protein